MNKLLMRYLFFISCFIQALLPLMARTEEPKEHFTDQSVVVGDGLSQKAAIASDNIPAACVGQIMYQGSPLFEEGSEIFESGKASQIRFDLAVSIESVLGEKFTAAANELSRKGVIKHAVQLRNAPNGKVIDSMPKGFFVSVEGVKDCWYFIRGFYERECDSGWIRHSDLVEVVKSYYEKDSDKLQFKNEVQECEDK